MRVLYFFGKDERRLRIRILNINCPEGWIKYSSYDRLIVISPRKLTACLYLVSWSRSICGYNDPKKNQDFDVLYNYDYVVLMIGRFIHYVYLRIDRKLFYRSDFTATNTFNFSL